MPPLQAADGGKSEEGDADAEEGEKEDEEVNVKWFSVRCRVDAVVDDRLISSTAVS